MGQRANLILMHSGGYSLFYCHWCANTLPRDLFWGPQYATAFVQQQRAVSADGWLDTIWAEGGVVIDPEQRTLLLYGGEDILFDIPLRRVYLTLLQYVWSGWNIRWAYHGIVDLALYAGVSQNNVIAPVTRSRPIGGLQSPAREHAWIDTIGSIIDIDRRVWCFPLARKLTDYLHVGPKLVDLAERDRQLASFSLAEWTTTFPHGGFHIDVPHRTLAFWSALEMLPINQIAVDWPGWTIQTLGDDFEVHVAFTDGKLQLSQPSADELLNQLRDILLYEDAGNSPERILAIAAQMQQDGSDIQINPFALRQDPLRLTPTIKQEIFTQAVTAWRRDHL